MLTRTVVKLAAAMAALTIATAASADGFVNGGFDNGSASGWTQGGGYRGGTLNPLNPANYVPGDGSGRSAIIAAGTVDPTIGAAFGTTVYAGGYSFRVEDTASGGYTSVIQQQVNNYTDANIFFAWKSVLENGGHPQNESATMVITLRDLTTSTDLVRREYNAGSGGGGVDPRFTQVGSFFYTPQWQIEQIAIDSSLSGHNFLLTVLAADCQPTGHEGYVYLDGFGATTPPPGGAVPEPATWAMMILGMGGVGGTLRAQRRGKRAKLATA